MIAENVNWKAKIGALVPLLKLRLSLLVCFSSGMGYLLALRNSSFNLIHFTLFIVGGLLVTAASNILNQIIEKESDKLMKRTAGRPLPTGVLSVQEALLVACSFAFGGLLLLGLEINWNTAILAGVSLLLYAFVYTPLKKRGPIAVLVGAFPGAFPPMIGWLAVTNQYGWEPGILFAIQFFWQFPHFWAIAWVLDEDYQKAGIRLLPNGGKKDMRTAFLIMIYTLFLIPLGFAPYLMKMAGFNSAIVATICGVLFLAQTFWLMKECTRKAALWIMFGSFLYLPIVQIAFVLDKLP
jgi:protoheme IX farnesyltransferase